ncbi:glycoside hydrolase [Paenibacillus sp. HJL G12]|uniref:Glycoside hydrolase n=1 Tax=Paenibacillus dendrobii TaxID=2691084 RepID=A0A7X3IQ49_9BACL|nr:beta-galactosidase [Paenibacillus dendrobii]MWV46187.1 glycoside hydrolase [Paenibacillus dendrobii]
MLIFYDGLFPYDGARPGEQDLNMLREAGHVVDAEGLEAALSELAGGTLVMLHAPYVPKQAWAAVLAFLKRGGNLLSLGGAPFKRPVRMAEGKWKVEAEQTAYHQQLHIHEALRVESDPVKQLKADTLNPLFEGHEALFDVADTWNLVPHVTKNVELPHQMGSAGSMDTQISAILKGYSADGREVAAPVVQWENSRGPFAGGRWLFVNQILGQGFWEHGGAEALLEWAAYCSHGVTEWSLKPGYAAYLPGERAVLTLQTQDLGRDLGDEQTEWTFNITVRHADEQEPVFATEVSIQTGKEMEILRIPVPEDIKPGMYRVECRAESEHGETRYLNQGYWGHDAELLSEGTPVSCGRDYFIKDGRPLPVVGMTYMASDVARKFLFLPNAAVWDKDMAQMAHAGINWIRTGIWTAYRNVMQADGHASEEVLRAIDAFLLTAKKHGLQVTFTFFSFTPEPWEGLNPYLDPRSLEAQKRFIRSITLRHQATSNVDWDLINEPSMFDPERIFSDGPRSSRDPFEKAAFVEWLKERHGDISALQERWNMTPEQLPDFAAAVPPEASEINFDIQDIHSGKKGTRWLDYVLFSMEMHNRWASELTGAIKRDNPDQLVTVGQDEALGASRPSPFFYGKVVDYTTVHSWWLNDHLVWDGIFAKTVDKPNLIQETGIMYVETPDGRAKRSEKELRSILERKYAYAFSTGGAGAIHWIWNTNFYMDNANESHIGALRADGTEKSEADVSYDFGSFIGRTRDLFVDRQLEDVVAIFPYSNDFSNRKLAFEATTRLTRILSYELKVPFRAIGEYQIDDLRQDAPPKLILLPSAHNIADEAFELLIDYIRESGSTLLVTGPIGIDAYWHQTSRLENELGRFEDGTRMLSNVVREEVLDLDGQQLPVSFGNRKIAQVMKEVFGGISGEESVETKAKTEPTKLIKMSVGNGQMFFCPLPVEISDREEAVTELYRFVLAQSGYTPELEWISGENSGIYGRKLLYKEGALFVFVSEQAMNTSVAIKDKATGKTYAFELEKERSVLFAVDGQGELLSVYRPHEVSIEVK